MAAYLIVNYDVTDAVALDAYRDRAAPVLLGEGELLAADGESLHLPEGSTQGTHTVVLAYPDKATARAVYESEAYRPLLADRLAATTPRFAMIVGA